MEGMGEKRNRNFSKPEIDQLVDVIIKYKSVIENKRTDGTTWMEKIDAWEKVAEEFNAVCGGFPRSGKTLRSKYYTIKKKIRKTCALVKHERAKTGGGSANCPKLEDYEEKILGLTEVTMLGLPPLYEAETLIKNITGLCMLLRSLAYPNRLSDLEQLFGYSAATLSQIINAVMKIISENHDHLLKNLINLNWLNIEKLKYYAEAVSNKGAPIPNCWGFIDGTARAICRPTILQEDYYSGHKRQHSVKYQSILCPDGIIVNLSGAYPGRRHDAGIFRLSNIYQQLEQCAVFPNEEKFVIYGDQAYGIKELLLCPFTNNRNLTEGQLHFNNAMKVVRQSVEWGFGKIIAEFAFLDFKKNQKLLLQDISTMYTTATILTNCHTCLYSSLTAQYFNINPPQLEEYLCAPYHN